ncbi:hypothetical protein JOB18_003825 [Solea senegalensis]|uniref:Uncharacterized protein n=1 Tax=Solea senegalensis TaxID=28829 RepID=A0AAV6PSK3_SOLSE|nr:hypothetical protein JOB18_003825 [Solea senegalensis]
MPSIGLTIPFALINSFGSVECKLLLFPRPREKRREGAAAQNMRINSGGIHQDAGSANSLLIVNATEQSGGGGGGPSYLYNKRLIKSEKRNRFILWFCYTTPPGRDRGCSSERRRTHTRRIYSWNLTSLHVEWQL